MRAAPSLSRRWPRWLAAPLLALGSLLGGHAAAAEPGTGVYLERLTWTEVRDAIRAGKTTVIVPVGGTEQSGPHLALGKHNVRATVLAGRIAEALGNALVAPVLAYVPEGSVSPPTGHMRFAGTISIPDAAFQAVLDGAARSLQQHGFTDVVLIGDHGGYQRQLGQVVQALNRAWAGGRAGGGARAHFIAAYYDTAQRGVAEALAAKGLTPAQVGSHAGSADTALTLAIDPTLVRTDRLDAAAAQGAAAGVDGDPRAANAEFGRIGTELIVARSVAAIRAAVAARR